MKIEKVVSRDGTQIALEKAGEGPSLVLVGGAFCDRKATSSGTPLAARLAHRFTVSSYDRRGRGDSGDVKTYSIDREIEDLALVIEASGGSAFVFGNSSGALLALDAAARGLPIPKLVCFEPPLIVDPAQAEAFAAMSIELKRLAAEGRRAEAAEIFLTQAVQMPAPAFAQLRTSPAWPGLEALAHTLSYDVAITARGPLRIEEARSVKATTLVLSGSASPPWMRDANESLARTIPGARQRTLEGQTHAVDAATLAAEIEAFLSQ